MAAGLGFKTFNTGDVLSAADTNGYLMQGVLVFANAAARDAAITSPQEGQCCYLKDTDAVQTYSGAAWVGFDDSNAIQNSIVDAKGDIVAASGNDTPARLAVGNNGDTLVADSATATGLSYQPRQAAGKNAIINGGFDVWQRSTSAATSTGTYPAPDRWWAYTNSGSATFARESTIIPSGALYAGKITATASSTKVFFAQAIETANVAPFINKTITVSGQLAASTTVAHILFVQYSTTVDESNSGSWTTITASTTSGSLTPTSTTYVSFANTYAIPSNAKSLRVGFEQTSAIANGVVCYYGNIQLELGSVATTFSRAGGTIQGELAACQRYYYRAVAGQVYGTLAQGVAVGTTAAHFFIPFPVTFRTTPASAEYANLILSDVAAGNFSFTSAAIVLNQSSSSFGYFATAGSTGMTLYRPMILIGNNNAAGYVAFSAEL
jgi:hypothetical protein